MDRELNTTREQKKVEAIKRMKALGVFAPAIDDFKYNDMVNVSEPPIGALYWLDDEQKEIANEWEERSGSLVFLAIRSFTTFGKMDSFLYVSDYPEEWDEDMEDIKDGRVYAYVHNYDMPDCSEAGSILVKPTIAAGLLRYA